MALQKTWVPLTFQGLDTKTDEKTLSIGKLTELKNADITQAPSIEKRTGYDKLGSLTASALYSRNGDIVAVGEGNINVWDDAVGWISKGACDVVAVNTDVIVGSSIPHLISDFAFLGSNAMVFAYQDANQYLTWGIIDRNTGTFIVSPRTSSAFFAVNIRIVANDSYFWIFAQQTPNLRCICGSIDNPSAATTVIHQTDDTGYNIDAVPYGNNALCVYRPASGQAKVFMVTSANVVGSPGIGLPGAKELTAVYTNFVSLCGISDTPAGKRFAIACSDSTTISFIEFNEQFSEVVTGNKNTTHQIARTSMIFDGTLVRCFFDYVGAKVEDSFTGIVDWNRATTFTLTQDVIRGTLVAKPQLTSAGKIDIATRYSSDAATQPTGFIHRFTAVSGKLIGRFLPSVLGSRSTHVSNMFENTFVCQKKVRASIDNITRISYEAEANPAGIEVNDTLVLTGSFVSQFDGVSYSENGFLLFPEPPVLSSSSASGGSMSNGTYLYCAVYEYTDANGNIHRSSPSAPTTVTLSGGGTSQKTILSINYLWNTLRTSYESPVVLHLYRTQAGGSIFYKTTSDFSPTINIASGTKSVLITDTRSDSALSSRELLYTTGGIVENIPPPSSIAISRYNDTVVVSGAESGNRLYFSKPTVKGDAISFSDILVKDVATDTGITALLNMDQSLLICTPRQTLVLTGTPYNALGTGQTLSDPQILPSDIGCLSQKAITKIPDGALLQSEKGIWLIDRGFNAQYIGAEVEAFIGTVNSAFVNAKRNKVIFTQSDRALVFDYFYRYWSTYEVPCLGGSDFVDGHCLLAADGAVLRANATYGDRNAPFSTVIATGWISLAGLQGFQRIYAISMLGEFIGSHRLKVELMYDFSDVIRDAFSIMGDTVINDAMGSGTYGTETPYGGIEDGVYRFVVKPRIQKCSSIKIRISDEFPESTPSGGFKLTNIQFEVGSIGGRAKFGKNRTLS